MFIFQISVCIYIGRGYEIPLSVLISLYNRPLVPEEEMAPSFLLDYDVHIQRKLPMWIGCLRVPASDRRGSHR